MQMVVVKTLASASGRPRRNFVQLNVASLSASGSALSRKLGQLASIGAALERSQSSLSKYKRGSSVGEFIFDVFMKASWKFIQVFAVCPRPGCDTRC